MSYGLTAAGFAIKTQDTIRTELENAYRGIFGAAVPVTGDSVFGQEIGIFSEQMANLWELAQAVYLSPFPDSAQGVQLASSATITGQSPLPAAFSTVTLTLTGTNGTVIPAGSLVGITGTTTTFATDAQATIAGTTATVTATATTTGALTAPAGTLTVIKTPVAGWTAVTNAADALVGRDAETDAIFRSRRLANLAIALGGPVAALRTKLAAVTGVTFAGVKENRTDATDVSGLPPHSYQITVIGGSDADVAAAIWAGKSPGMATTGTSSATVTDEFGNAQTVYWIRGTNVPMYLDVTLTRDASTYPADGDARVAAALVAFVATLDYGADVLNWQLIAALGAIPGILSVVIKQDRAPAPSSSANTAIASNEKATLTGGNIAIH
jgi:uncharacterized phage protein gp47/JayE